MNPNISTTHQVVETFFLKNKKKEAFSNNHEKCYCRKAKTLVEVEGFSQTAIYIAENKK